MRVITGTAKGRRLLTLEGDSVRPTTERVKEALFSIIQFEIEGRRVLDLFAGSGQLGIEALSRGADSAQFVDESRQSIEVVTKNLKSTGLSDSATIAHTDSISFITATDKTFDIVFMDPPYSMGLLQKALPIAAKKISVGGVIICESPNDEDLPTEIEGISFVRKYKYGKIALTVYRKTEA